MRQGITTAVLICGGVLVAAGCGQNHEDASTTANGVTPSYEGGHYNPAVNSSGSGVGTNDPAVNGASHEINGGSNSAMPGLNKTSGTSDQNGGSGSPSGATGNSAGR